MDKWFLKDGQICFKDENAELNNWDLKSVVSCLNTRDDKISDLEAKLAESENRVIELSNGCREIEKIKDDKIKEVRACWMKRYDQLKQQLAETDKLMQEYLSKCLSLEQQLAEKDGLLKQKINKMKSTDFIKMCVDCGFMVQAKEIDNQTAIEELEKVIKLTKEMDYLDNPEFYNNDFATWGFDIACKLIREQINKQIAELKGEK